MKKDISSSITKIIITGLIFSLGASPIINTASTVNAMQLEDELSIILDDLHPKDYYAEITQDESSGNDKIIVHFDREIVLDRELLAGDLEGRGVFGKGSKYDISNITPKLRADKTSIELILDTLITGDLSSNDGISLKQGIVKTKLQNTILYDEPRSKFPNHNDDVKVEYYIDKTNDKTIIIVTEKNIADSLTKVGTIKENTFSIEVANTGSDNYTETKDFDVIYDSNRTNGEELSSIKVSIKGKHNKVKFSYIPDKVVSDVFQLEKDGQASNLTIEGVVATKSKNPILTEPIYDIDSNTITLKSSEKLKSINKNNNGGFSIKKGDEDITIQKVDVNLNNEDKVILTLGEELANGNYTIKYDNPTDLSGIVAENSKTLSTIDSLDFSHFVDTRPPMIIGILRRDSNVLGALINEKIKDNTTIDGANGFSVEHINKDGIDMNDITVIDTIIKPGDNDYLIELVLDTDLAAGKYNVKYENSNGNIVDVAENKLVSIEWPVDITEKATISDTDLATEASVQSKVYDIQINIENDKFKDIPSHTNVSSWFKNLPDGLDANTTDIVNKDELSVNISIEGSPTTKTDINEPIIVKIPNKYLQSGMSIQSTLNQNAIFNIKKAVVLAPILTEVTSINKNDNTVNLKINMNNDVAMWDNDNSEISDIKDDSLNNYLIIGENTTKGYSIKSSKKSDTKNNVIEIILQKDSSIEDDDTISIYTKNAKNNLNFLISLTAANDKLGYKKMPDNTLLISIDELISENNIDNSQEDSQEDNSINNGSSSDGSSSDDSSSDDSSSDDSSSDSSSSDSSSSDSSSSDSSSSDDSSSDSSSSDSSSSDSSSSDSSSSDSSSSDDSSSDSSSNSDPSNDSPSSSDDKTEDTDIIEMPNIIEMPYTSTNKATNRRYRPLLSREKQQTKNKKCSHKNIDKNDGKLTLDDINLPSTIGSPEKFKDIKPNFWAINYIDNLSKMGIIKGIDNNFIPSKSITMANATIMITKMLGLKSYNPTNFIDVKPSAYYAKYSALAKEHGIIKGLNGKFMPNNNITRQDMIIIIGNLLKTLDIDLDKNTSSLKRFKDRDDISKYAKEHVAVLVNTGIISGYKGKVYPKSYITRAEMSRIISNLYDLLQKEIIKKNSECES